MSKASVQTLKWIGLAVLALVAMSTFPERATPNDHDYASQSAITHWLARGVPWGVDVVQNVGPLGFINFPRLYSGELWLPKLVANAIIVLAIVFSVTANNALRPPVAFALTVLFALFAFGDAQSYLLLFLLFADPRRDAIRKYYVPLRVVCFAGLTLAKSTFAVPIIAFYFLKAMRTLTLRRDRRKELSEAFAYLASVLILWAILGQDISNIPEFVRSFVAFSTGYSQTLLIYERPLLTWLGLALFVLLCIHVALRALGTQESGRLRIDAEALPGILARLAVVSVVYKHSYVRADDGHILTLAYFSICAAAIVFVEIVSSHRPPPVFGHRVSIGPTQAGAMALAIITLSVTLQEQTISIGRHIVGRAGEVVRNGKFLISPHAHFAALSRSLEANANEIRVPLIDSTINGMTFSYYGYKPAITLFTNGAFVPTVSTISFAGWNNQIAQRDLRKIAEAKPKYFLVDVESIDYLYPPQNSPLLFRHILDNYRPIVFANGVFLYERTDGGNRFDDQTVYSRANLGRPFSGKFSFNREGAHEIVFMDIESSLAERLLSVLYKPPEYSMQLVFSDGSVQRFKTSVDHLRMGLSNSYVIRSNEELLASNFGAGKALKISSLVIGCRNLFGSCDVAGMLYSKVVAPPAYADNANPALSRGIAMSLPIFKGAMNVDSPFLPRQVGDAYLFHAPSSVEIPVPQGSTSMELTYVMLETSYSRGGRSHGVVVRLTATHRDGKVVKLMERQLDPFKVVQDREEIHTQVALGANTRSVLLTVAAPSPGQDHFAIKQISFR